MISGIVSEHEFQVYVNSGCSVTQSCPTLWSHELQHAWLPCPSVYSKVCSNSCLLSQWCHPTISSTIAPPLSPPALNDSQHQGLFQWVSSSHQVSKVLKLQPQHWYFQWIFKVDFFWNWLVWSPWSPRDSQESSAASQFKSINSWALSLLYGPTLTFVHDYCKT